MPPPRQHADISLVLELVNDELDAVNQIIRDRLHSDVVLVSQVSEHIINSGGKRLRPIIALLAARACGYRGQKHCELAAIIEFIHTATLLHDDVVDESDLRRGQETANTVWGNAASVLVGDFLYSRSFQMMIGVGRMRVMEILADTTNRIAEGEVMQLMNLGDADTDEARYFRVIADKTAKLFEAASRLGAILAESGEMTERALISYGIQLGTAFQIVDDMLDYRADQESLGKTVGDDLAEGKPTLPLIRALEVGTVEQGQLIRKAIEQGGREFLPEVLTIIEQTNALQYCASRAQQAADNASAALEQLPRSPYREALDALARYSIARTF